MDDTKHSTGEGEAVDMGPYGPRGKDTPPLGQMMGGYGLIFLAVILAPLLIFLVVRFGLL